MIREVVKRDGRIVNFDGNCIYNAIVHACNAVGQTPDPDVLRVIVGSIQTSSGITRATVDEIQIKVENALMDCGLADVARAYIVYRNKRDRARKSASNEVIADIIAAKKNEVTRENANMNADTPAGMMMKVASERSKEFVVEELLSEEAKQAVQDNILHVHDADYLPTRSLTCIQHPIDKVLSGGFRAGHGESRPAKRIETASILAAISMETIQNRFCSL